MFRKLTIPEKKEKRSRFRQNPIYSILYTPLWRQRGEDLSPEEVWIEGNNLASLLKGSSDTDSAIIVQESFDDLCLQYSVFIGEDGEHKRRSQQQSEHSAMMVSFTAFLLLLNVYSEKDGHPYSTLCKELSAICCNIKGFHELYEGARQEEDERESRGEFIETSDFIEQIAYQDEPASVKQTELLHQVVRDFVVENETCDLFTMKENERLLSRANDNNEHCIQTEVDLLRKHIKEKEGTLEQERTYENLIFDAAYNDKVQEIRQAIYPFVKDGVYHIDAKEQRQWLAIIEPLKLIDGLLITHDNKKVRKECTDSEICQQMEKFFGEDFPTVSFEKIPKSISAERAQWRNWGVGLTFEAWRQYLNRGNKEKNYEALARVAIGVYGSVIKVIRG